MLTQFRRARHLQRYQKIVVVFARHGFGSFLETLQLNRYLPINPNLFHKRAQPEQISPAEHFRLALEELGPTFIKLGQILSTRPDLFPADFVLELSKLQDRVPPNSWEQILALLKEEYGQDPDQVFSRLDPEPLGSASLSQVHPAELPDGSQVVVKIQRPNIHGTIESDLEIMNDLAALAQRTAWGKLYNPVEIVNNFAFTLQNELDYRREGLNADRFRENFAGQPNLFIPKVYWDYSTAHVLVLERMEGIKIDDFAALEAAGYDRRKIASISAGMIVKEILEDGFFHADPHPGNFLILAGSPPSNPVIGAMDFGMVGHVSRTDRMNMVQAIAYASQGEAHALVEHFLRMGAVTGTIDMQSLERDVERMLTQYRGIPLKLIQARRLVEEVMGIAFKYHVTLPADLWLLFKTTIMMDGLARQLDPDFDLVAVFAPPVRRILLEMRMPWTWGSTFFSEIESLLLAMREAPAAGGALLRNLQRGQLPVKLNMGATKETLDRLDRISTRISLSILIAAFILGLALLLPTATGNRFATGLIHAGFMASLALGIWVAFDIIRSGR